MKPLVILFLLLGGGLLTAQSRYTLLETHFIPATYYVGDTVEMHITFFPGDAQDLFVSSDQPVLDWVEIKSVELIPQAPNYEVIIAFIPFATGSRTLPRINLGGLNLDDLRIYTSSLLEGQELSPTREQVLLPMTEMFLTVVLGLLVLIPLVLWRTHARIRDWYARQVKSYTKGRPYKRFSKEIQKLKTQLFGLEAHEFYLRLQTSLREYLSGKWDKDLLSFTSRELKTLVDEKTEPDQSRIIMDFFHRSDVIIFDRRKVDDPTALEDLEILKVTVDNLEEAFDVEL